jgi:uncharacterized protein YndB with AHSA1/START domain
MAEALATTLIDAPVETVWATARDFNGMPVWNPGVTESAIEDGRDADSVGCVRAFTLADGSFVRERLVELDDSRYRLAYNFETPAFPVGNYLATLEFIPVTNGERTFARWHASFDEAEADRGTYGPLISKKVFAAGLRALAAHVAAHGAPPEGAQRWQGLRPAKVFTSSVIRAPLARVWERMRDFASMKDWHEDIGRMEMIGGVRPDKVSGVRDFLFGEGHLHEELTWLSDRDHAFRYRILKSPMAWMNYHAGARLWPITDRDQTFAVWTADWTASPNDDLELIPNVHDNVFQKAFDTLDAQLRQA